MIDKTYLEQTVEDALRDHALNCSQAQLMVYERLIKPDLKYLKKEFGIIGIKNFKQDHMDALRSRWINNGNKNSTVNSKRAAWKVVLEYADRQTLSKSGIETRRVPIKPQEQWWLHPDDEERLLTWLTSDLVLHLRLSLIIRLMTHQGLRVSEATRIEQRHILEDSILVPGTKTSSSQASIPIFKHSEQLMKQLKHFLSYSGELPFGYGSHMPSEWNVCRDFLGVRHIPTSTMKSLRRTFAYRATQAGMPTAVLQQVMRHKSITTTEKYLRLVGGGLVEESRKYL